MPARMRRKSRQNCREENIARAPRDSPFFKRREVPPLARATERKSWSKGKGERGISPRTGGTGGRKSTCIECSRHFFATSCRALHAYNAHMYTYARNMQLNQPVFSKLSLCITCDSYVDRDKSTFGSKIASGLLRVRQIPRERCARFVSLFFPLLWARARALGYLFLSHSRDSACFLSHSRSVDLRLFAHCSHTGILM